MMTMENHKIFDLEKRTENFALMIIAFSKKIPNIKVYWRIIPQVVASGTSIGAHYHEASEAESLDDFSHKISISNKEAKETKYWLHLLAKSEPSITEDALRLWQEAHELHLIFSKIVKTCRSKKNKK